MKEELIIQGVTLTHADKVMYPDAGITKADIAKYYESVESRILPFLEGRPVSLVRSPEGIGEFKFYQKHPGEFFPDYIERINITEKSQNRGVYITIDELRDLLFLTNLGVLEYHTWGARVENLNTPDVMIYDLDPSEGSTWKQVMLAARMVKRELDDLSLKSFLKTSGQVGLHILVPLTGNDNWEEVKDFSREISRKLVEEFPEDFTLEMLKKERKGKVFLDFLRNSRGSTNIAAYSTRAFPGASVSTPISWDELNSELSPSKYTIQNLQRRFSQIENDPWEDFREIEQKLP